MPRQLRNRGGIMTIGGGGYTGIPMGSRTGFGLISKVKDRVRKLIPNELANVAVKAAPLVAMIPGYGPTTAALMRGIGRFDQRGSLSDAFKQGIGTYVGGELFGAGMEKIGLRDPGAKGIGEFFGEGTRSKAKTLFKGEDMPTVGKEKTGPLKNVAEKAFENVPFSDKIPTKVKEKLLVGGVTAGASALYSYFTGEFEPQQPGETTGEYLARRDERVKQQMRGYMDSYYTPLRNPQYAAMSDEEKNNFINSIVGQTSLEGTTDYQGKATGGRVGYQTGGINLANTLAENIARNRAAQAAFQQSIAPAQERVRQRMRGMGKSGFQTQPGTLSQGLGKIADDAVTGSMNLFGLDRSKAGIAQDPSMLEYKEIKEAGLPAKDYSSVSTYGMLEDVTEKNPITRALAGTIGLAALPVNELARPLYDLGQGVVRGIKDPNKSVFQAIKDENIPTMLQGSREGLLKFVGDQFGLTDNRSDIVESITPTPDAGTNLQAGVLPGFTRLKNPNSFPGNYDEFMYKGPDGQIYGSETYGRMAASGSYKDLFKDYYNKPTMADVAGRAMPLGLMMPPSGNYEDNFQDPYEGLSGQEYAEKYGIPYNQGGRVGLMGGAMPMGIMRTNKAGVMERDYRDKGGFVPVGIKEKADDVPAMLSKNEFVFTADAVRGAGNGSIEKGAQKMYDTMKNLERRVV